MVNFEIKIETLIQVKWLHTSDGHAYGVAKKLQNVVIFDEGGIFRQDGTLLRLFDVALERDQAFAAGFVEQIVDGLQGI